MQHHASTTAAIALDVDQWAPHLPRSSSGTTAGALAAHGWRAVTLTPRDHLEVVWQELGRLGKRERVGA
jgi:hypothetical protein